MTGALAKLHISHAAVGQLVLAIILGGFINVPITRLSQPQELAANPLAKYCLDRLFPSLQRQPRETVIAVNVAGCIIPLGIAIYQLTHIAEHTPELLTKTGIAEAVTTIVCYFLARPVAGVGIAMPGFVHSFRPQQLCFLRPVRQRRSRSWRGSSDRWWGQICSIWPTYGGSELAWPATGERGHSTASYSQESFPLISPEPQHVGALTPLRTPQGRNHAPAQLNR
jgi:hypothetical protein